MPLAGHDRPGKESVQPHMGHKSLKPISNGHQYLGADVKPDDGAAHDHGTDSFRSDLAEIANQNRAERNAHEVRFFYFQRIKHFEDIPCDVLKIVMTILLDADRVPGFTMTSQIDEEHVEMPHEGPDLEKPDRRTAAGAMDKHHPGGVRIGGFICLVVKHWANTF